MSCLLFSLLSVIIYVFLVLGLILCSRWVLASFSNASFLSCTCSSLTRSSRRYVAKSVRNSISSWTRAKSRLRLACISLECLLACTSRKRSMSRTHKLSSSYYLATGCCTGHSSMRRKRPTRLCICDLSSRIFMQIRSACSPSKPWGLLAR